MRYKILKKAIRINFYEYIGDTFSVSISLLSGRIEKLTLNNIVVNNSEKLLHTDLKYAIILFKSSKEYIEIEKILDSEKSEQITELAIEYNIVNDVSKLKYFDTFYPEVSDVQYSSGFITRYIADFLNHNYLIEISAEDFDSINNKDDKTHYEAYNVMQISWKLTGKRSDVLKYNKESLNSLKRNFGESKMFYMLDSVESGPFYLTEFDEIPKLYTIGNELIYENDFSGFAGYYHYIKSKLLSGKRQPIGPNEPLIEDLDGIVDFGDDESGSDIISDVGEALQKITDELNNLESALANANSDISNAMSGFEKNLNDDISNLLGGSDLKDIFTESFADALAIQNDPNMQAEIEKKYEDRANSEIDKLDLSKSDKDKLKKKKTKTPKIKIPNFHIGRPPHREGTDHNSEVGF